jgi:hypothetical protein
LLSDIFNDDANLSTHHLLNDLKGKSAPAAPRKGRLSLWIIIGYFAFYSMALKVFQFAMQRVGFEVIGIVPVPLPAFSPVPLAHACRITAGLLAIFQPRVWRKPTLADTTWPFPQGGAPLHHRSPSSIDRRNFIPISQDQELLRTIRFGKIEENKGKESIKGDWR